MGNIQSEAEVNALLSQWLGVELQRNRDPAALQLPNPITLVPQSGDAGMRRYFSINGCDKYLAVFAPTTSESNREFVAIAEFLRDQGIRAPRVFASDLRRGFLLIEKLGQQLLLPQLNTDTVGSLYADAMAVLLKMQQSRVPVQLVPQYDREKLLQEMQLFPQWFVTKLLGYSLSDEENIVLNDIFDHLIAQAQQQPQCFVHRDFHSRNLIYNPPSALGVIDFQDAVVGPVTYDVVSLLKDCYIRWPRSDVERWALNYAAMAVDANILPAQSEQVFLQWFDWMGLQRHIKVLGIFARLHLRDNKPDYLHDLPLVTRYTLEVTERYPIFAPFNELFMSKLLPLAEQQAWYVDYRTVGDRR